MLLIKINKKNYPKINKMQSYRSFIIWKFTGDHEILVSFIFSLFISGEGGGVDFLFDFIFDFFFDFLSICFDDSNFFRYIFLIFCRDVFSKKKCFGVFFHYVFSLPTPNYTSCFFHPKVENIFGWTWNTSYIRLLLQIQIDIPVDHYIAHIP